MEFRAHASSSRGNFYTVSDGENLLAIECGLRFPDLRRALGFRVSELCGCLVSHEHKDHSRAASDLARAGVDIYASAGTLAALGLSGARINSVTVHERFFVGPWTVYPFDTTHDAAEPLGFVVITETGEKLLYASDTPYLKYMVEGLTVIAIECNYEASMLQESSLLPAVKRRIVHSHFSLEYVKGFLQANDLSRVREIHLLHMSDGNSDAARFKREVQELTGKPVVIAEM